MRLLTVGRPKVGAIAQQIVEYQKRLSGWTRVSWDVVPEVAFRLGQERYAQKSESQALLGKVSSREFMILLDIDGEMVSSLELSRRVIGWQDQGHSMVFVVGGSLGVDEAVKDRAQWRWSLSRLTLPHSLAQLVVVEQLYRAYAIYHHHPYHK